MIGRRRRSGIRACLISRNNVVTPDIIDGQPFLDQFGFVLDLWSWSGKCLIWWWSLDTDERNCLLRQQKASAKWCVNITRLMLCNLCIALKFLCYTYIIVGSHILDQKFKTAKIATTCRWLSYASCVKSQWVDDLGWAQYQVSNLLLDSLCLWMSTLDFWGRYLSI